MKPSRYNYFIDNKDNTIVFNGITERFFEIHSANKDTYIDVLSNPEEYAEEAIQG